MIDINFNEQYFICTTCNSYETWQEFRRCPVCLTDSAGKWKSRIVSGPFLKDICKCRPCDCGCKSVLLYDCSLHSGTTSKNWEPVQNGVTPMYPLTLNEIKDEVSETILEAKNDWYAIASKLENAFTHISTLTKQLQDSQYDNNLKQKLWQETADRNALLIEENKSMKEELERLREEVSSNRFLTFDTE